MSCVLLVAPPGKVGEDVVKESIASFIEMPEIEALFIGDAAPEGGIRAALKDAIPATFCGIVVCVPVSMCMDAAFCDLADRARSYGMTHALWGYTTDRLLCRGRWDRGAMLPPDWREFDALQIARGCKFQPLTEIMVNLTKFTWAGPVLAVPLPLVQYRRPDLRVGSWPDAIVVMRSQPMVALEALSAFAGIRETLATTTDSVRRGVLELQLIQMAMVANLTGEVAELLKARVQHGEHGWGDRFGLYWAKLQLVPRVKDVQAAIECAELGADLLQPGGLTALAELLRPTMPEVALAAAERAAAIANRADYELDWMVDPADAGFRADFMLSLCSQNRRVKRWHMGVASASASGRFDAEVDTAAQQMATPCDKKMAAVRAALSLPARPGLALYLDVLAVTDTIVDKLVASDKNDFPFLADFLFKALRQGEDHHLSFTSLPRVVHGTNTYSLDEPEFIYVLVGGARGSSRRVAPNVLRCL